MQPTPAIEARPVRGPTPLTRRTSGAAWHVSRPFAQQIRSATERTGSAFAAAALSGLVLVVAGTSLLAHAAVADEPWALLTGCALWVLVAATQIYVRRWVLRVLARAHRQAGLSDVQALRCAHNTLRRWAR